jgi:CheY-like chemotaxis protein
MPEPILVVDDDASIRTLLAAVLTDEGYSVALACNGRAALDCLTDQPPRLILLDLQMPVMDGWTFHAELRARALPIPVVYMTAGAQAQQEAERHHADGFLAKPFELDELIDLVQLLSA